MNFYRNHFRDHLKTMCDRGDQLANLCMWITEAEAETEKRWYDRLSA